MPIDLLQALTAQQALRKAANLLPETFPIPAFVGMVSDEIEALRYTGKSDEEIAALIRAASPIEITAAEIAEHYAPPETRHQPEPAHDRPAAPWLPKHFPLE